LAEKVICRIFFDRACGFDFSMGELEDLSVQIEACKGHIEEHGSVDVVLGQRLVLRILAFGQVSSSCLTVEV